MCGHIKSFSNRIKERDGRLAPVDERTPRDQPGQASWSHLQKNTRRKSHANRMGEHDERLTCGRQAVYKRVHGRSSSLAAD